MVALPCSVSKVAALFWTICALLIRSLGIGTRKV